MTKFVIGDMTFSTSQARTRAADRIRLEAGTPATATQAATGRGLTAEAPLEEYATGPKAAGSLWWPGGCVTTLLPQLTDGRWPLRCAYWHPDDAVVDKAADDLRTWLDANGKGDGYVGTVTPD